MPSLQHQLGLLATAVILGSTIIACSGDSEQERQPTATAAASASRTSTATSLSNTSTEDPTGIIRTPVPLRLAGDAERADCPATWLVYEDEYLSMCYPSEHYAHTWFRSYVGVGDPVHVSVRLVPGEPVAYTPWSLAVWALPFYSPPNDCLYETEHVQPLRNADLAPCVLAESEGIACTARLGSGTQFKGTVPAPFGALEFHVDAGDNDQLALAQTILGTLRFSDARLP